MTPQRLAACLAALRCPRCGEERALHEFPRNKANSSGRGSHCLSCVRAYQTQPEVKARTKERRKESKYIEWRKEYRRRETVLDAQRERRRKDWPRIILHGVKYRCKQRGITFDLKPSDVVIPAECPILREPFDLTHSARSRNAPTIDRIDPRKGYTPNNVRVISWYANRIKSDCESPEVFEAIARYMREGQRQ